MRDLNEKSRRRVAFEATGIALSSVVVVASVLAVLQAALGVHAVLTGLKLAGVT
jgi:hypothetical protein